MYDWEKYSDVLKKSPKTPFSNFVSKRKVRDRVDIARPRSILDTELQHIVNQTIRDRSTRIIPILGKAGTGKTHTYHAFKLKEIENQKKMESHDDLILDDINTYDWSIVYIPSPSKSEKVLMHIYKHIIEELGIDILDEVSYELVHKWVRKGKPTLKEIEQMFQEGKVSYADAYVDCFKCLSIYALGDDRKDLAKRWLLADKLSEFELNQLDVNSTIGGDEICLAMLKIITENLDRALILYFDEFESPYKRQGKDAVIKLLAIIKKLYKEVSNLVIVLAVLKGLWSIIIETADEDLLLHLESNYELKPFSLNDVKMLIEKTMEIYWKDNDLYPPDDPLFPFNKKIIESIHNITRGNPRLSIKLSHEFFKKFTSDESDEYKFKELEEDLIPRDLSNQKVPSVFISYSREEDNIKHSYWVINLAEQLSEDGVHILDSGEARPFTNIPSWMERSIENADFVLLICTKDYAQKANTMEKGEENENLILNSDLYYSLDERAQKKIICLLRSGNPIEAIPRYLSARYFLDFRDKSNNSKEYKNLLRKLCIEKEEIKESLENSLKNNLIFISYCRSDKEWLERLKIQLKPLERYGVIESWDDNRLKPGTRWRGDIEKALDNAKVAILLVSANFLASDFIIDNELPPLLKASESKGTIIFPVIIGPCLYTEIEALEGIFSYNDPSEPLSDLKKNEQETVLRDVAKAIKNILNP